MYDVVSDAKAIRLRKLNELLGDQGDVYLYVHSDTGNFLVWRDTNNPDQMEHIGWLDIAGEKLERRPDDEPQTYDKPKGWKTTP